MGPEASYTFEKAIGGDLLQQVTLSANVTNPADTKGVFTAVVTSDSGGYQAYPIPSRMFF